MKSLTINLWGEKAKFRYLFLASIFLLFAFLGAKEIWTQEHRWADIVSGMFYRHDFLHPYLGENQYYDKPLLSYWLIVFFVKVTGLLNTWALRLPSALAGLLAIFSIYRLGLKLKNKSLGLLSGWMLLTTFYFVFWARTSSADMLNLAGSLFATAWYIEKRDTANFFDYAVFFIVIALTSLCKGLVGLVVPLLAVFVDIFFQKSWRYHLRLTFFLALIPAVIIYFLPFVASTYFGGHQYGENGLYLVYRENILRYFQPFDHKGPLYTYFIYLPIYLLPWTIFFVPACLTVSSRWKNLSLSSKWLASVVLILFLFFTLSGSRRSYYILPIIPFAILFTADWLLTYIPFKQQRHSASLILISFILIFILLDGVPAWYFSQYGIKPFAETLKKEADQIQPWASWQVVMLDAESKLNFYLQLPPATLNYDIKGGERKDQTLQTLTKAWPIEKMKTPHTIFITRQRYAALLQPFFSNYREIRIPSSSLFFLKGRENEPVAFIPLSS